MVYIMFSKHCLQVRQVAVLRKLHKSTANPKPSSFYTKSLNYFFKKNLVLTNTLTSGSFMAMGDMIHQEYEYRTHQTKGYDWQRIKRMFIVGCFLGSLHHYYYLYLDILIPKTSLKAVLQKVAGDQFFCAPLTIVLFFYGMGFLENKTFSESTEELKRKFKYVYLGDCIFWPPVQAINFYYLPSRYRVFYINAATMIFDVFLSLMKHYDHQ
ncbi:mpv17 / PMP22 family domain-containing protein [Phthorimaea operculella]|nr:mpv17 / PMP22 family domain-containing protein [Phthorimaea operculella]